MDKRDADAVSRFSERLDAAMLKSIREARMRTNWAVPRTGYEQEVSRYIAVAMSFTPFLDAFSRFEEQVGAAGAQNGLIETVLKLTSPGVPDIYQGAELWEQSMVDPDNRREVNFLSRGVSLEAELSAETLLARWRDGAIKQRIIAELLSVRAHYPSLFSRGSYEPVPQSCPDTLAFVRRHGKTALLVAVRLYPWRKRVWRQAKIELPASLSWTNVKKVLSFGEPLKPGTDPFLRLPVFIGISKPT
jgi:maltooligosyltrehalose synthase